MEEISNEIKKLNSKIDVIESMLKKPFRDWTEEDKNFYGDEEKEARKDLRAKEKILHERLNKWEDDLREEKKALREKEILILQQSQTGKLCLILYLILYLYSYSGYESY